MMDKEIIQLLWKEASGDVEVFATKLLFEAAKILCVSCKTVGPSQSIGPHSRIHTLRSQNRGSTYEVIETCRAPGLYFDEPAQSIP